MGKHNRHGKANITDEEFRAMKDRLIKVFTSRDNNLYELADKIGMSRGSLSYTLLSPDRIPQLPFIMAFCKEYNISADYILFGKEFKNDD